MSAIAFQNALARLIIDPDFRDQVRLKGRLALGPDLAPKETQRLLRAAQDPGMDVTRMLHKGFRLNKLLGRLPMTCALLPKQTLAAELGLFWKQRPPTSFYYLEEAIAFAEHLLARGDAVGDPYLPDVAAFECAGMRLELPRGVDGSSDQERVRLRHDPSHLFPPLRDGRRPDDVADFDCVLLGARQPEGAPQWTVESLAPPHGRGAAARVCENPSSDAAPLLSDSRQ